MLVASTAAAHLVRLGHVLCTLDSARCLSLCPQLKHIVHSVATLSLPNDVASLLSHVIYFHALILHILFAATHSSSNLSCALTPAREFLATAFN